MSHVNFCHVQWTPRTRQPWSPRTLGPRHSDTVTMPSVSWLSPLCSSALFASLPVCCLCFSDSPGRKQSHWWPLSFYGGSLSTWGGLNSSLSFSLYPSSKIQRQRLGASVWARCTLLNQWGCVTEEHGSFCSNLIDAEQGGRVRWFTLSSQQGFTTYEPNVCPHCTGHWRYSGEQAELLSWSLHYSEGEKPLTRTQINTVIMKLLMGINGIKEGCSEEVTFKLQVDGWQWMSACKSWGKSLPGFSG